MNVELTKEEIEHLLYTIRVCMFESGDRSEDILSLKNKLTSLYELENMSLEELDSSYGHFGQ